MISSRRLLSLQPLSRHRPVCSTPESVELISSHRLLIIDLILTSASGLQSTSVSDSIQPFCSLKKYSLTGLPRRLREQLNNSVSKLYLLHPRSLIGDFRTASGGHAVVRSNLAPCRANRASDVVIRLRHPWTLLYSGRRTLVRFESGPIRTTNQRVRRVTGATRECGAE